MINLKVARSVHLVCLIISRSQITQKIKDPQQLPVVSLSKAANSKTFCLSLPAWWEIGCNENRHLGMRVLAALCVDRLY